MNDSIEAILLNLVDKVDYLQDDITSLKVGQESIIKALPHADKLNRG